MLPKVQNELKHTFKIGDDLFVVRPWKTKDERNLLLQTSMNESSEVKSREDLMFIDSLILPCVISGDVESLSSEGIRRLFIEIKMISTGDDTVHYSCKCPSCEKQNEFDISISECLEYKSFGRSFIKINDDLSIKFKPIKFREIINLMEDNLIDQDYAFLLNSIDSVEYMDEIYDEFTIQELSEFIDELPHDTFSKMVSELIDTKDSISIKSKVKCRHCSEDFDINIDGENDFLEY